MWSTARTNPLPERPSGTAHYGRTNADGGDGINTPAAGAAGIARANTLTTACLKYDRRGSQLDLAARNVATGPASPNRECHISETQMLAHIKPGEEITYTHLIANGDPLIAGAFAIRQVWFVGVVDGLTGAVSWVALFSPSALEMYFAMRVAYLIDAITGFDHGGFDAQGWDYALNPMYVVERRDVCVLYWGGRSVGWLVGKRRGELEECVKMLVERRGANGGSEVCGGGRRKGWQFEGRMRWDVAGSAVQGAWSVCERGGKGGGG